MKRIHVSELSGVGMTIKFSFASVFQDDTLVAQAAIFLSAGFETSSHVISAMIYFLTVNVSS